jgi:predicted phage tail component-like protein
VIPLANYNSGFKYNSRINYNSAVYFIVEITDSAHVEDSLSLNANINTSDNGSGIDSNNVTKFSASDFYVVTADGMLQPLGVRVLGDSRYELFPSIKEFSKKIPGRHGEIQFDTKLKSRLLELHVATDEGNTPEGKEELKHTYAKYLNPSASTKQLVFLDDMGKSYPVKYSGKIDPSNYPTWFDFTIPLKMNDPHIIGTFEKSHSGSGTLSNEGNAETPIIITITGTITNPSITFGSEILSYTGTIADGQTLIIDTSSTTAELNGEDVTHNITGDIAFMLRPGNTTVTADNKVSVSWRERWE